MKEHLKKMEELLNDAQSILLQFDDFVLNNIKVDGRTLKQWEQKLTFDIPEAHDIDFAKVVDLSAKIMVRYQWVCRKRDQNLFKVAVLKQRRNTAYNSAYQEARREHENKFKKTLAAKSCEVQAALEVLDLDSTVVVQEVIKDFWNKAADSLVEMRKLIEIIARSLSSDAYLSKDIIVRS